MMYHAYQTHSDLMWPVRTLSRLSLPFLEAAGRAGAGRRIARPPPPARCSSSRR